MNGVNISLIRPAAAQDRHNGKDHELSPPGDVKSSNGLSLGAQTIIPANMGREKAQEASL
jgi:hypothetical protein